MKIQALVLGFGLLAGLSGFGEAGNLRSSAMKALPLGAVRPEG